MESQPKIHFNILSIMSAVFLTPPLVMWLSFFLFMMTGFEVFEKIIAAVFFSERLFPEFLAGFGYPAVAIFFGIVGRSQMKDGTERGRKLSSVTIVLGCVFILLTVIFILM